MKYGAPEEIRTPDPQIRSLANGKNNFAKSILCAASVFCASAETAVSQDKPEWNPPHRYDRPYDGHLVLHQVPQPKVVELCRGLLGALGLAVSETQRGCAYQVGAGCIVVTIDKPFRGTTPEAVLRHEMGHCLGWPADHPDD